MRLKADLLLLSATLLWGSAFVAMRLAAGHGTVFILNGLRFMLGGIVLLPLTRFKGAYSRENLLFVALAGFALFAAVGLQQAGLVTTSAGNAGFITILNVVIVPVLMWIFWHERPTPGLSIAILLALAGGFLLSTAGTFTIHQGDVIIFIGSFFWAMHVVVVARAQGRIDPLPFAFGQFIFCGMLNLLLGIFIEHPTGQQLLYVTPAIIFTAVLSIALGFTLQVIAQKHTPASDAALILTFEAVFAAFFGWLFLHETLLPIQIFGCGLIMGAVIVVQLMNGKMRTL